MAEDLEQACLADPLHFSPLREWAPAWSAELVVAADLAGAGWSVGESDVWRMYRPPGRPMVSAGWKTHVSTDLENAETALQRIAQVCGERRVAFKHLVTLAAVVASSSRTSTRESGGKFVVLYPDDDDFPGTISACVEAVRGLPGPFVLTDRRWDLEAPVFFRYGAFRPLQMWTDAGARVLARMSASGLVPDDRTVPFRAPEGVLIPDAMAGRIGPDLFPSPSTLPVEFTDAIQHSNSGGVYRGVERGTGRRVIIKEARPWTGASPSMDDALTRLRHESEVLSQLGGDGAPAWCSLFQVDEHEFMAAEEISGMPLRHWVAMRHPALSCAPDVAALDAYRDDAEQVARAIVSAIEAVHEKGWAHNDLHPGNVMVRDDLSVALIDFEFATLLSDRRVPGMHCGGFASGDGTAQERDDFGMVMIRGWMMHPAVGPQFELVPTAGHDLAAQAQEWFGEAVEVREAAVAYELRGRRAPVTARTGHVVDALGVRARPEEYVAYLRRVARPHRPVLFPGHVSSTSSPAAALSLAHGTSGVLLALLEAGAPVEDAWIDHFRAGSIAPAGPLGSPGLWDGWAGVAVTWAALGDVERACDALARASSFAVGCTDPTLWSGLAGLATGAALLESLTGDPAAGTAAIEALDSLADRPDLWLERMSRTDLMSGPSGPAAVLASSVLRFPEETTRHSRWWDAARIFLDADLARCELKAGALQIVDGGVALPHLGQGSLGVALASRALRLVSDEPADERELDFVRAGMLELVLEPGLARGRIGIALAMAVLAGRDDSAQATSIRWWVDRHVAHLGLGSIRVDNGVALLGQGCSRVSADLATGTAGALAVDSYVRSGRGFLTPVLGLDALSWPSDLPHRSFGAGDSPTTTEGGE